MMEEPRQLRWPLIGGIAAVAAAAGFGVAHLFGTGSPPVPVEQAEPASKGPAEVKIPASYLQTSNIVVEPVASGNVGTDIIAAATVAPTPQGEAVVVARASGTVTRINRRLGDNVRAGEALAFVDSLDAATMSADSSVATAKVGLARQTFAREDSLYKQGVSPRRDMEAARAELTVAEAEARRAASVASAAHVAGNGRSVAVVSPISGRITAETAMLGSFVEPQAALFRVANGNAAQIEASVTAEEARRIQPGDAATIILASGDPVEATVRAVTPTVSGSSQTATVLLTPAVGASSLIVGQGVQVRIRTRAGSTTGSASMTVPDEAVQSVNGRDVLFVRTTDGFRAQPVLVGTRSGGSAQILSGVKPGDKVATRNAFLVKAELNRGEDEE
ncbi:efflux RND transporter periplasmic adaptor subunit [Sphingobium sp. H39-3-25]|uniref:efflux RND transporter periplasmic adaptor subunit n=1 Tax=Sphingobium arseniciresistens TaxID=3030834 RepID=UPI0023B9E455|nr:efflux RND transporter periplasmic adaptor subunit [Sphingobium arseniciresistens]